MKHALSFAELFDLAQAFQWVWENIAYISKISTYNWGGNRNLTLMGKGSEVMAVSLLRMAVTKISVYGVTDILVTASSGDILNEASFLTIKALEGVDEEGNSYVNNLRLTNMLADALDCPTSLWKNRNATITCLQGVEALRLVKAAASLSKGIGPPNVFLPQTKGPDMFSSSILTRLST
ncbi:hypothetical protein JTE90_015393 [Oedothorax gibbosus]|uniref:Uncharacterized protein n=1 Tax=Oedothorax gibbosus TaxID=931172 RepID=A0AAV6TUG6_9ARAC|nr:hypothetical protein JTE90_015393 [Oedothorax gibbosus]